MLNAAAAWIAIGVGIIWGALLGLGFERDAWLGGYGSWRRRLLRLGHIACFGVAFLNLAFVASRGALSPQSPVGLMSALMLSGLIAMPAVCLASAFYPRLKPLFALPVVALALGAGLTAWGLLR
ncbi:MAG: hypothetical protein IPK79_12525 [Vampirovibrionales bacterium]|nr:hypothetical protein [Vampirovibrionales bacterium]